MILEQNASLEGSMAFTSVDGRRFVIPFFKQTGSVAALDVGGHGVLAAVSVYDAPFDKRSHKLAIVGSKISEQGTQLALSADGSLLAVLCGEEVFVFQLPPP
jgi:hypothetical protein